MRSLQMPLIIYASLVAPLLAAAKASDSNRSSPTSSPSLFSDSVGGQAPISAWGQGWKSNSLYLPPVKDEPCECFNCLLPKFNCGQYGQCNEFDGQCECPPGWGGLDCLTPLCDSLADGPNRHQRTLGEQCKCSDGWSGVNCNTCQTDQACANFRIPGWDYSSGGEIPPENMTCYKGGDAVRQNFQMCDVTNPAIIRELGTKKPQVTFSCTDGPAASNSSLGSAHLNGDPSMSPTDKTCAFQFWIASVESFYCTLSDCDWKIQSTYEANVTEYKCEKIQCDCVPGRMLCGEDGSVNLLANLQAEKSSWYSSIDEFLQQEVTGPGTFTCSTGKGCQFKEPAMNDLIDTVFGDPYITLQCDSGECLHYTQVPGYQRPERPDDSTWLAISVAAVCAFVLISALAFFFLSRTPKQSGGFGSIRLPAEETAKLMADHVPASLQFSSLSYTVNEQPILSHISGTVKHGEIMAIMGASGAGKSTLLDILALKSKRGTVGGDVYVNGKRVSNGEKEDEWKRVVGFVDQEDTLMSTLTVYETVLYSALLRLPREMSLEAKKFRTLETMQELGILSIKDSRIGESGRRSISGGEKRRVSIACELVTSPSVILLDEPTSGLDAYNAFNVIESLVTLAKDYNRTVIFTIHQPRSNIVALFDRLVLLAKGRVVYSGEYARCQEYFESLGHPCPPGFNIADFLIDLTARPTTKNPPRAIVSDLSSLVDVSSTNPSPPDAEAGFAGASRLASQETAVETRAEGDSSFISKAGRMFGIVPSSPADSSDSENIDGSALPEKLERLVSSFEKSDLAARIRAEIAGARANGHGPTGGGGNQGAFDEVDRGISKGYHKAGLWTQFTILSGRAFKNLYRNPLLMAGHYLTALGVALLCAALYRNIGIDLGSFQNRLGLFFFILALFAFSSLSSLGLFANERLLFMRERANGYYSPITYFVSKVLFDIIPLRVIPSILLGCIVYSTVGLVPTLTEFWKFILTLVLFNLATASVVLFISVAVANNGVASLAGSLVMLFNLLFGGLLMNYSLSSLPVRILMNFSFFHAAFEALLVNELRSIQLKDHKYGVDLEVPGAVILSSFGFRSQAFWWPDTAVLIATIFGFLGLSYTFLYLFVKERR
ncbi:Transporter, ABC superfamily (Breast cancer resistance protein) [Phaffia rhodozyma]|uniref:Transporter, ABC superfamily (Breast cancer resistance protein) n=1 Tax=Phaffia rhodozyma TaxID=264483 RepID=A0A0F7SPT9_PHARH|nr:Transporter, ABC superfamily (Breast cancer resistance protein) [Phaffia rhodozyma]